MKQLDINALGKMAQTLLVAGVTQKNVPATINRLVKIIDPDYDGKAMPSTLEIATFESDFDDGSSFHSPCTIDTENKTIVYIASAGCSSDDTIRLTSAQIRDRYGIRPGLITLETVRICGTPYEIDIKLVAPTDDDATPWSEAVLFRYGHEVAVTEVCDEFFGTWELAYDEDSFTIELTR